MGPLGRLFQGPAEQWAFGELEKTQVPDNLERKPIESDKAYLSIFLQSMYVTSVRKGLKKFYGAVHSYISLPYLTSQRAEFDVVTTPQNLQNVSPQGLANIVQMNLRLLGPIPYRGGDVKIEAGLFSIESENLTDSYLSLLDKISKTAGVSYISAALPFVPLIADGINMLAGASNANILEIGISRDIETPYTGYFFVMRAPKEAINAATIKLANDGRLLDESGAPIKAYPYMVFKVESTSTRESAWCEIPELSQVYKSLRDSMEQGNASSVEENFSDFRRKVLTSPDLLYDDAEAIVQKMKEQKEKTSQAIMTKRLAPVRMPSTFAEFVTKEVYQEGQNQRLVRTYSTGRP